MDCRGNYSSNGRMARGPFHELCLHRNSNSMENRFRVTPL